MYALTFNKIRVEWKSSHLSMLRRRWQLLSATVRSFRVFFAPVSMMKEVEMEESGRWCAHSDKVKLIEMNRSSGYTAPRHSL